MNHRCHHIPDQVNQFRVHKLKVIGDVEDMNRFGSDLVSEVSSQARQMGFFHDAYQVSPVDISQVNLPSRLAAGPR